MNSRISYTYWTIPMDFHDNHRSYSMCYPTMCFVFMCRQFDIDHMTIFNENAFFVLSFVQIRGKYKLVVALLALYMIVHFHILWNCFRLCIVCNWISGQYFIMSWIITWRQLWCRTSIRLPFDENRFHSRHQIIICSFIVIMSFRTTTTKNMRYMHISLFIN